MIRRMEGGLGYEPELVEPLREAHAEFPGDVIISFALAKALAVLYKEAWQDEQGYEAVANMLPRLSSCREIFITGFFTGTHQKKKISTR